MSQQGYADKIISEAKALIDKVNGDIEQSADRIRSMGLDPSKVVSACEPHMGTKQRDELAKLLAQDKEAIDREVDEGMARVKFSTTAPSTGRKPRPMV
jgi:hypothetical protein